ncbi:serine hydrolase [Prochlorothrix hollandica]|uniref:serine hydrolase n=1 Tax=Prochlorothrix hollandica TaxID=1223 RepID=UPI00034D6A7F|nr:serine hydrolase [Prochlorothrix hollandica]
MKTKLPPSQHSPGQHRKTRSPLQKLWGRFQQGSQQRSIPQVGRPRGGAQPARPLRTPSPPVRPNPGRRSPRPNPGSVTLAALVVPWLWQWRSRLTSPKPPLSRSPGSGQHRVRGASVRGPSVGQQGHPVGQNLDPSPSADSPADPLTALSSAYVRNLSSIPTTPYVPSPPVEPPPPVNPWEPVRQRPGSPSETQPTNPLRSSARSSAPEPSLFTSPNTMQTVDRRTTRSRRRTASSRASAPRRSAETKAAQAWNQATPSRRVPRTKLPVPVLYGIRLLILGVGIGVIGGTLLTALDPAHMGVAATAGTPDGPGETGEADSGSVALASQSGASSLRLNQELTPLKQKVQALVQEQADLTPGVMVVDLDTGDYYSLNGDRLFATASMIKMPILLAFFEDVDAGKIRLDEELVMREDLVATEAGEMQYLPVGTKFTALETAEEMIRISDNTATNMLIDRLGGAAALNQRFRDWGLTTMAINNLLPDLEGTNVSTPQDFALLMELINEGNLLSMRSRDRLLSILRTPVTQTLLSPGLGEGATIAHKTGDIGSLVGDVGLIDMPTGKRYLAVMMVERPTNDNRAQELIRQMSRLTYGHLEALELQSDQPVEKRPILVPTMLPSNQVATDEPSETATKPKPAIMSPFWVRN